MSIELIQQHAAAIARHAKAITVLQAPVSHEGKLEQIMAEGRMRMWLAIHRVTEKHGALWRTERTNLNREYIWRHEPKESIRLKAFSDCLNYSLAQDKDRNRSYWDLCLRWEAKDFSGERIGHPPVSNLVSPALRQHRLWNEQQNELARRLAERAARFEQQYWKQWQARSIWQALGLMK